MPEDAVREARVAQVAPRHIVERLGAVARAHAVDLHNDEAQLGHRLHVGHWAPVLRHVRAVGTRVDVLDDRVAAARVEVGRPHDDAPDVGGAVAALGHEDLGRAPAGGQLRRHVPLLQPRQELPVARAPQLQHRGHVDARVAVHVEAPVRGPVDGVVAVGLGVLDQVRPVEVDAVVVEEVGVLAGDHPARLEPDAAVRHVHAVHGAHDPLALRDLVLHPAGDAVVQVEVVPPVPFRHPDDLPSVVDVVAELLPRIPRVGAHPAVVEEAGHLLGDDGPRLARLRIHLDDAVDLMAALVVLECERPPVVPPLHRRDPVRVREERVVDLHPRAALDIEEHGPVEVEHVARLAVEHRVQPGLQPILGGRQHEVDRAMVSRTPSVGDQPLRVRRPADRLELVGIAL